MRKRKRGISDVIVVVLITFLVISAIVIVYSFIIPMIQKSAKDVDVGTITNSVELKRNSIIFNETLSLLQFSVNKIGDSHLSSIKARILVNGTSLSYSLLSLPNNLGTENYVLNITSLGKVNEIFIYPILDNGKIGIGQKEEIIDIQIGKIDGNLSVINPENEINNNCVSNWDCNNWSRCSVNYNLDNLLLNEITLQSEKSRLCHDKNSCNDDVTDRKECDDSASINVKKVVDNSTGKEYEIYDINNTLISRLEFKPGEVNQLNIEFPFD
jgi:hypothetical protein